MQPSDVAFGIAAVIFVIAAIPNKPYSGSLTNVALAITAVGLALS